MRGNVQDMLPSGWELAPFQSLADVDPDLMLQRENDFFVCVDGAVYSKDFAVKAQAMRTVSLGTPQVSSRSLPLLISINSILTSYSEMEPRHLLLLLHHQDWVRG